MNTMDDLRGHLFDALRGLKNKSIDVATAKAMGEVAQTIINTAKAEADFARATKQRVSSKLIEATPEPEGTALPNGVTREVETRPGVTVTRNRTV